MAYKKITGKRIYYKLKETNPGTVLFEDGIFESVEPVPEGSKFDGNNYLFRLPNDEIAVLNGSGTIIRVFGDRDETTGKLSGGKVTVGQKVRVTYLGKNKLTTGERKGMDFHDFDVEVDGNDPDSVEVSHSLPPSAKEDSELAI